MKAGGSNQCKKEKIKKTQNSKKKLLTIKARRRKIQKRRKKSKIKTAHNEGGDCSNERKNEDTSIWSSNNHCRSSEEKKHIFNSSILTNMLIWFWSSQDLGLKLTAIVTVSISSIFQLLSQEVSYEPILALQQVLKLNQQIIRYKLIL